MTTASMEYEQIRRGFRVLDEMEAETVALALRSASLENCFGVVERALGVSRHELISPCRRLRFARARQLVMWLAQQTTRRSTTQIGLALDRDHTTVIHGIEKVETLRSMDPEFRDLSDRLLKLISTDAAHS